MNVAETIRERLAALEPQALDLVDESEQHRGHAGYRDGGGTHWRLSIVSQRFSGRSTARAPPHDLRRARQPHAAPIHALAITARSPEETKGKQ
jgi:BolA protein